MRSDQGAIDGVGAAETEQTVTSRLLGLRDGEMAVDDVAGSAMIVGVRPGM